MRPRTAAAVLLATAAPATLTQAQSVTVSLTHDDADGIVLLGESVTWSLEIEFEGFGESAHASGMNATILANDPALASSSDMAYGTFNGGTNGGTSNGAGIGFVNFTNVDLLGHGTPDRTNPLHIGTFDTTALSQGTLNYEFGIGLASSAFVSIGISAFATENFDQEEITLNIDTLIIVPAQATPLLLAPLALLAATRRRQITPTTHE